jgi:thymidylate synthase (FAD)
MHPVAPKVFHIASTATDFGGLIDFLAEIGANDWRPDPSSSGAETVVEVAGRACYKSFGTGLNANITKVRDGAHDYIGNILRSKHGSVLEHVCDTFAFVDVSRVLTHELVRHRAGTAFSQESGRFCRIDEVRYYEPAALQEDYLGKVYDALEAAGKKPNWTKAAWIEAVNGSFAFSMQKAEASVRDLQDILQLDDIPGFHMKKTLQSAIRRVAPEGRGNIIVMTANHRAWRHIIANRTAEGAEEEIRDALFQVFRVLAEKHPAIYQDADIHHYAGSPTPVVNFVNEKV